MKNQLKELRNNLNLTQKQVALDIGITTSYYGMIEQSDRMPNLVLAYKISSYFNKTIEEVFFTNKDNIELFEDVS